MAPVWKVAIYDYARQFAGMVPDFLALRVVPRHNQPGTAELTVSLNHPKLDVLMTEGVRLVFWYKGNRILSGPVVEDTGSGYVGTNGTVKFTVESDTAAFWDILMLPVPASPITDQTASEFYALTGPAETVLKTLVTANAVNRDGGFPGITVAPDQGRGDAITVSARFNSIGDMVIPLVESAGLGASILQDDSGNLVVDVYVPRTYPLILSVRNRTLNDRTWLRKRPKNTKVFIGGVHTGSDRIFTSVTDADRESLYGFRAETFLEPPNTGKMVTDQDTLIANDLSAMNSAYTDYQNALAAIASPLQSFTDASSKYDAALAKESQADTAEQVAWAAMQGSATGSPLYNAHTTAQNAFTSAQTDLNTAYTTQASAQTALTNAQNAAASAKTTYTNAQTAYNNAVNGMAALVTAHRTELAALGNADLASLGASVGISLTLTETSVFSYGGDGVNVGDVVQVAIGNSVVITEVLREAALTATSPFHAVIDPTMGDFENTPERVIAVAVARQGKQISDKERSQ